MPSGVVLTGGSAKLKGVIEYSKKTLGVAARLGKATGFGGVAEHIEEPQFAAAVGLMLIDSEGAPQAPSKNKGATVGKNIVGGIGGILSKAFGKVK